MSTPKKLSPTEQATLLTLLQGRFAKNKHRHPEMDWATVQARLEAQPDKLWSLQQMEDSGGEPDMVGTDPDTGAYWFMDCAVESPKGRRSLCYDREALEARKEFKPDNNVLDAAAAMGIELLNEAQYRLLQQFGPFDTKTSSWLQTPYAIRRLGGAIYADYRYDHIFIYHNGASSYYAVRGFRGLLRV